MAKEDQHFIVDGTEIGDPVELKVRSLGGGVKGVTFTKKIMDFFRNPKSVRLHTVIEDGRTLVIVEVVKKKLGEVRSKNE